MNQIEDKVKDLVEVRANQHLDDFIADLNQTLAGYFFTDITSDLMSKWIDRVVVMPTGSGNAYALAGYRGVGKSHFLAVFGAILSQPELRAKLKDAHVFASAERLIRRHYPVVHIRRGTKETLADELSSAVAAYFESDADVVGQTPAEIIKFASEKAGAGPSILIIDTDIERESRVTRDDGGYLSELAQAAEGTNVFVAIALDDDVATADGRNSGIASTYTIDYLDHEHLYKIIDSYIFPKNNPKRRVITSIFENFQSVLPSFRWSEQRFSSVYPLHPVILEVAPFVRLFVQDFALLAFASEAGAKILERPADSLIALDELFDKVESNLRKSPDLADAFAAYDSLNENVIHKLPVMERLRSKLVLKALMVLSLDSEGATASDVASAVLIFDPREPQSAIRFVEELLEKLSAASEGRVWKMERDGRAPKFGFSLSGKEHFNTALAEAAQSVPESVVNSLLRRLMRDRFADCEFESTEDGFDIATTELEWRGGVRHGRVIWNVGNRDRSTIDSPAGFDWSLVVDFLPLPGEPATGIPRIQWIPDALKAEEFDALRRYHTLMSREDLQQTFRNEFRTTIQTYTIAVEKIWERKFLQYGKFLIDGSEYSITPEAAAGHKLSEVIAAMLSPYFERQFPEHPSFGARLDATYVDGLATGLFAARESISSDVRKYAEAFAVPMGLADVVNGSIEVRPVEGLLGLPAVTVVIDLLSTSDGVVTLDELNNRLAASPFGFTLEAQRLLLTALVARGVIEFVTTNSDRIGSRSLDLRLVWEDIAGISVPTESQHSSDRLVKWAALLCSNNELTSINTEANRKKVKVALLEWLEGWRQGNILELMDKVPDDSMTTELWHSGSRIRKSFGSSADAIASVAGGTLDVEAALRMIQEAFSASTDEFELLSVELAELHAELAAIGRRGSVKRLLAGYEVTLDPNIEEVRKKVLSLVESEHSMTTDDKIAEVTELCESLQRKFDSYFDEMHALAARSHETRDKTSEVTASREWWVFENLARSSFFPQRFWTESRRLMREFRACNCTVQFSDYAPGQKNCPACGFSLKRRRDRDRLPDKLRSVVHSGLACYERIIASRMEELLSLISGLDGDTTDAELKKSIESLLTVLADSKPLKDLSESELRAFQLALKRYSYVPEHDIADTAERISPIITAEAIIEDAVVVN